MLAGLPTLSELRSASFAHLGQAADWWECIGGKAESGFADLASGGLEWRGAAASAAVERAETDMLKVRACRYGWSEAAAIARLGEDTLVGAQRLALEAVADAERGGFTVGEDYSVADTRPTSSREQQAARRTVAQAHANYIRHRVTALVAHDADLAARLKTATAGFGTLAFEEPGGGIQLIGNQTPQDAPTGHVTLCEPYTSGGGFVCWEWYLDGAERRLWSPTDISGGWP